MTWIRDLATISHESMTASEPNVLTPRAPT
jgi:hypothetical protein